MTVLRHLMLAATLALASVALLTGAGNAWRWPLPGTGQQGAPCVIALVPFSDAAAVRIYKQRLVDGIAAEAAS